MAMRFSSRILFIKDVVGNSEICTWGFYGDGVLVGEVCCTSIVYATDKKHTKIDFPDARIHEELCKIFLYESDKGKSPDAHLIKVTSGPGASALQCNSDDDDPDGPAFRTVRGGAAKAGLGLFRGSAKEGN